MSPQQFAQAPAMQANWAGTSYQQQATPQQHVIHTPVASQINSPIAEREAINDWINSEEVELMEQEEGVESY